MRPRGLGKRQIEELRLAAAWSEKMQHFRARPNPARESLRARGLLGRSAGFVDIDRRAVFGRRSRWYDWWITPEGRAALAEIDGRPS